MYTKECAYTQNQHMYPYFHLQICSKKEPNKIICRKSTAFCIIMQILPPNHLHFVTIFMFFDMFTDILAEKKAWHFCCRWRDSFAQIQYETNVVNRQDIDFVK